MNNDITPSVLFSNSLELLLSRLKENIQACPQDPFYRIEIVVTDVHMKTLLQLELAKAKGTVFGLEVTTVAEIAQKRAGVHFLDLYIAAASTGANPEAALSIANELAQEEWFGCSKDAEIGTKCQQAKKQLVPRLEKAARTPHETHVFGVSALCPKLNDFLLSLPHVFYYVLSPCMHFWGDICSDQEAKKLTRRLHTKHSQALQGYLYDRSKFLANHGTRSREFISYLEDKVNDFEEKYVVKRWVFQDHFYSQYVREEVVSHVIASSPTVLDVIQNDLLLMGRRSEAKLAFTKADTSVQVHKAPTVVREVEVLYQYIQEIMPKLSGRIVVYAPDIEVYRPYLQSHFTQNVEIIAPTQSELFVHFLQILDMPYKYLGPKRIYELFQLEAFRSKCGIEFEDLQLLAAVLQTFDTKQPYFEDQVILSWITFKQQSMEITSSDAEALGKCLETLESLFGDIQSLHSKPQRLCLEWQKLFLQIFEKYFAPSYGERDDWHTIKQVFMQVCQNETLERLGPIDQEMAVSIFKVAMAEQNEQRASKCVAPIIFATLGQVRSLPKDAVCFLGMHEGSFPRSNSRWLKKFGFLHSAKPPYTVSAIDRHLVMEAILTATSMVYISYQSYGFKERSFLEPAGVVLDILETLDLACTVDEDLPSKVLVKDHSLESFQEGMPDDKPRVNKSQLHIAKSDHVDVVYINDLRQVAKYPLKAYLQHGLGLYLSEYKTKVRSSEFEVLDQRKLGMAKKQAFTLSKDALSAFGKQEYRFLPPALSSAACSLFDEDMQSLLQNAKALGIKADEPLSIELSLTCKRVEQVDMRTWMVPALVVDVEGSQVTLAGALSNIYPEGIAVFDKKSNEALYKVWPELLLMNVLANDLPVVPNVLFIKEAKVEAVVFDDPALRLKDYIKYALECRKSPSCLYPDWIEQLGKEELPPAKLTEPSDFKIRDPYLDLYLSCVTPEDFQIEWQRWRHQALQMFK